MRRLRRSTPPRLLALLAAAALVVAGCTGVPRSSHPQAIQAVGVDQPAGEQVAPPEPGADQRTIVSNFLAANAATDLHHNGARAYLTPEAKGSWSDATVTVVDNLRVSLPAKGKVAVTGVVVGTVSLYGVYTPALRGDGSGNGGQPLSTSFTLKQVKGQWRIDSLQNGLIVTSSQFDTYQQRSLYFFDLGGLHLVPDPRYTNITDTQSLEQWLMSQLARGPRDTLQSAEATELPAQTDPSRVVVTQSPAGSSVTSIEVPGSSQLSAGNRNRLAAQIAETLSTAVNTVDQLQITDSGTPVVIPAAAGPVFTAEVVTAPYVPSLQSVGLYYVENGGVRDESGTPLTGPVGHGGYGLDSAAMADRGGTAGDLVAGTRANNTQLDVGTTSGLVSTDVHGTLSRPDWAPGLSEVWIGDGSSLLRVVKVGKTWKSSTVAVTTANGKATGQISAVRLSPEGSRVALVLTTGGSTQVWVGAVVRNAGLVQVDSLAPITPQGITITDVAWNDELKLFAIGHEATDDPGIYEVQVDGSLWTAHGIGNLPPVPDSITVAEQQVAAVSADGTVWKQQTGAWVSPQSEETHGSNPFYSP
ncbi:LpqB family beta-propeller domain-containing protein [Jatrophihabitans sp.]|uniref:LpqB family beta-propeller domain-containing protein n=1 Tax=Jatrophihabitans sp. TaxID=1932789 RepID=UPI0030C6D23F|nr:Lipoprotein LpqB beta-propeller protein [Jatrophihabitans sp.]